MGVKRLLESIGPWRSHHTLNTITKFTDGGEVSAWSRFLLVEASGTTISGDYVDSASDGADIAELLARYAHVIDNRDWDEVDTLFTPDVRIGASPAFAPGVQQLRALVGDAPSTHGHNTTDIMLDLRPDGTVRAWCKFFIVRGDGTVGSGDYQDTLVRTVDGWRIAKRDVSRGNRLDDDPTGGASTRTFSFDSWLNQPDDPGRYAAE